MTPQVLVEPGQIAGQGFGGVDGGVGKQTRISDRILALAAANVEDDAHVIEHEETAQLALDG